MTADEKKARKYRAMLRRMTASGDALGVVYVRLALAHVTRQGVRLSADDVHVLLRLDGATQDAIDAMALEFDESGGGA